MLGIKGALPPAFGVPRDICSKKIERRFGTRGAGNV